MPYWNCAGCSRPLQRVGKDTVVSWKCDHCQLSWVTRASLVCVIGAENLSKFTDQLKTAPATTRALTCPECETASFRVLPVGFTEIDICTNCHGVILDPGEVVKAIHNQLDPQQATTGVTVGDFASGAGGIIEIVGGVAELLIAFIP